jgi:hypothetical protein
MTQIERREARIRRIRARNFAEGERITSHEQVAIDPNVHHCIGKSEDSYDHIGLYVMERNGDPAVKVSLYS